MRQETDAELVARTRDGDLSAFEAIVDRHRAALVGLAAGRLGSLADAEDVAQEAFVQAYFRLHQLRKPEALPAWLRRLTDRLALMRLRRRREEPVEPARVEQMQGGSAASAEGSVDELLGRLPDGMRQAVALTCLAGYTSGEAAALLGVKEGTVRSRLSRARAMLKEVIEMAGEEPGKGKAEEKFTRETVERLMREARRLLESGKVEAAGERAEEVLEMQARADLDSGGDFTHLHFDEEAARISGLAYRERRRRDCEANAEQYGYRLGDLDWKLADVDVLCETLGKPVGQGKDVWGIPLSRERITMLDARDVWRRLRCSPQVLAEWVERGCPALRCWPFVRFDWERVKQWLRENRIDEWPRESDDDVDRPMRLLLKAVERGELTAKKAEGILEGLELA
jgi:RNA polymerase sigma-70 factor (ECF subfamily)